MKLYLGLLVATLMTINSANPEDSPSRILFNFETGDDAAAWAAVNDGVMGGRSEGGPSFHNGVLHFAGRLSLENNGGFSSLRSALDVDLSEFRGIRLRVRGDGRGYQLRLQTDSRYVGRPVSYMGQFSTLDDEWRVAEVSFDSLRAGFRGRSLGGYVFDPAKIERIGLMLADKQPGPFRLEVDWIEAYR